MLDERKDKDQDARGTAEERPEYSVDIEGVIHPWPRSTISTEEIAELGGWAPSLGVIEIDTENVEHVLKPGQIVELKEGHGFAKRIRFKRG